MTNSRGAHREREGAVGTAECGPTAPATGEAAPNTAEAFRSKDTKDRPILFSGPMVRAILDGRKTQTRRIVKPEPHAGVRWCPIVVNGYGGWTDGHGTPLRCRYGSAGDRLWVRETWRPLMDHLSECTGPKDIRFAASVGEAEWAISKWKPAIHMPRWASRITLLVTEVRIQRLHEITEADARAEGAMYHDGHGVGHSGWRHDYKDVHADARSSFARLWCEINGTDSWNANPWVWVVCFERALDRRAAA